MKHLLLTTIAAVVLVGCGESQVPSVKKSNSEADQCMASLIYGIISIVLFRIPIVGIVLSIVAIVS